MGGKKEERDKGVWLVFEIWNKKSNKDSPSKCLKIIKVDLVLNAYFVNILDADYTSKLHKMDAFHDLIILRRRGEGPRK